jgi:sodium-dependent phosphate transporter
VVIGKSVLTIVLSWIISPILSGIIAGVLFYLLRTHVLGQVDPVNQGFKYASIAMLISLPK